MSSRYPADPTGHIITNIDLKKGTGNLACPILNGCYAFFVPTEVAYVGVIDVFVGFRLIFGGCRCKRQFYSMCGIFIFSNLTLINHCYCSYNVRRHISVWLMLLLVGVALSYAGVGSVET